MKRLIIAALVLISFTGHSQSYLGKSQKEIIKHSKTDFINPEFITKTIGSDSTYIKVYNKRESLHYLLINDICVEFLVVKPYQCNCLEYDIQSYNDHCIALGDMKWKSKDHTKIYQMSLEKNEYSVSVKMAGNGLPDDYTLKTFSSIYMVD